MSPIWTNWKERAAHEAAAQRIEVTEERVEHVEVKAPAHGPGEVLDTADLARIRAVYGPTTKPVIRVPCVCIGGWDDGPNGQAVRCNRCIGSPGWVNV